MNNKREEKSSCASVLSTCSWQCCCTSVGDVQGQAEVDPAESPEIQSSCRPQPWEHESHTFCNEFSNPPHCLIAYKFQLKKVGFPFIKCVPTSCFVKILQSGWNLFFVWRIFYRGILMGIISGTCRLGFWCLNSGVFFPMSLPAEQRISINFGRQGNKFLLSPWRIQPRKVQILVLKCSNRAPLETSLSFPQDGTQSQFWIGKSSCHGYLPSSCV